MMGWNGLDSSTKLKKLRLKEMYIYVDMYDNLGYFNDMIGWILVKRTNDAMP